MHKATLEPILNKKMSEITVGILTVSDRCSKNEVEDTSGDNLARIINLKSFFNGNVSFKKCLFFNVE